jgi:hypothetical protein
MTTYTVAVSVSGLTGSGLVLQLNGADNLAISANGPATFSSVLSTGAAYNVTVSTQPNSPAQTCTVGNGTGTIGSSNITTVAVDCATDHSVSAIVSGLMGSSLVLELNSSSALDVIGNGTVTFPSPVPSGSAYSVTVKTEPTSPLQNCTVGNGSGTVGSADITNVTVTCVLSYGIGVIANGLSGSGLVVQLNGGDDLLFTAPSGGNGAAATFSNHLLTGTSYVVTVKTQPSSPTQTCAVSNGTGVVASASVFVTLTCPQIYNPSLTNAWTWFVSATPSATLGIAGLGGPPVRYGAATWVGEASHVWLFGGSTWGSLAEGGDSNDLWYYDPATGLWTWVSGDQNPGAGGVWGMKGVSVAGNNPSGRDTAAYWTDAAGNFWLFGGEGLDSTGAGGLLNDLWEYTPSSGYWTWVGGSSTTSAVGVYGMKGVGSISNIPGARIAAATWRDASGNLWLFGGQLQLSPTQSINDLWKFTPANGTWTWVGGPNNVANSAGTYGTTGVASVSNSPGARYSACSWTDASGNLWLFGGEGYDSNGNQNELNDLWKYNPAAGTWTWVGGANIGGAKGIYGTQGTRSVSNMPGARYSANCWTDAAGNFWLFAGNGFDSVGTKFGINGGWGPQIGLNDQWKYNPTAGTWTWVKGSDIGGAPGIVGTSGLASISNMPGAQINSSSWVDAAGHLWMFGGINQAGAPGNPPSFYLGSLWAYTP